MSEIACLRLFTSTELLERVLMTSALKTLVGNTGAHSLVEISCVKMAESMLG